MKCNTREPAARTWINGLAHPGCISYHNMKYSSSSCSVFHLNPMNMETSLWRYQQSSDSRTSGPVCYRTLPNEMHPFFNCLNYNLLVALVLVTVVNHNCCWVINILAIWAVRTCHGQHVGVHSRSWCYRVQHHYHTHSKINVTRPMSDDQLTVTRIHSGHVLLTYSSI